jgi:hypothetical protein
LAIVRRPKSSAVLVLIALSVAGCGGSSNSPGSQAYPLVSANTRIAAPSLALSDAREQRQGSPRAERRQVLVVNLVVPGALASNAESAALAAAARDPGAANTQFVRVVEDAASVHPAQFVAQGHVVSFPSAAEIKQSQQAILLAVTGFPTCLVVDRSGRIAARIVGLVDSSRLLTTIRAVTTEG